MDIQRLSALVPGQKGTIVGFSEAPGRSPESGAASGYVTDDLVTRLLEMGFEEGLEVELLHQGPLGGDPIAVKVDQIMVGLRRAEASYIEISTAAAGDAS